MFWHMRVIFVLAKILTKVVTVFLILAHIGTE